MNILPKKRWHVRNRENIARVRKDELAAQNEEKEKERRKRIAEQEAKLEILRSQSKGKDESSNLREESSKQRSPHEHINFFEGVETVAKNEQHELEIKEEKEKYEKQIGYLTYLGQNTNEADGRISWYNKPRSKLNYIAEDGDKKDEKSKLLLDPLRKIESILRKKSTVVEREKIDPICKKKIKSDFGNSSKTEEVRRMNKKAQLKALREKRLKREREEKKKIDKLLAEVNCKKPISSAGDEEKSSKFSRRYNSQFNPHLARQNYIE